MTETEIEELIAEQRAYFATGSTIPVDARIAALRRLERAILDHEQEIYGALKEDLGKSVPESYMCEVGLTLSELRYQIKHVRRWARHHKRSSSLANFPSRCFTVAEPYGVTLIMSPWNYPFMLTMEPLAGAIAAGNCCVLKPSAYSPATSAVIRRVVEAAFNEGQVAVVEGGRAENTALLDQRFDYIFFTGGTKVGRLVMEKASANLTPVTLEMGGKSPCIITSDANLKVAAARVVFGKYLNCGQTCVAPDYILVDQSVHDRFVELLKEQIETMFGTNPLDNPDYGKIINRKHYERIMGLIDPAKVLVGGEGREEELRIAPTIMDNVTADDAIMGEEIFGPVMPIISYESIEQAEAFIKERPKPLALYLFTRSKALEERFLAYVPFGGGCVNDTIVHLTVPSMGFGGVGASGMGSYHGKKSFETFSHEKSILKKANWLDLPMRYQPYATWKDKAVRMFLR